jgi:hypothetical protein
MGVALVALVALGALIIWHAMRRARLIREKLAPPRIVRLPDVAPGAAEPEEPRSEPR